MENEISDRLSALFLDCVNSSIQELFLEEPDFKSHKKTIRELIHEEVRSSLENAITTTLKDTLKFQSEYAIKRALTTDLGMKAGPYSFNKELKSNYNNNINAQNNFQMQKTGIKDNKPKPKLNRRKPKLRSIDATQKVSRLAMRSPFNCKVNVPESKNIDPSQKLSATPVNYNSKTGMWEDVPELTEEQKAQLKQNNEAAKTNEIQNNNILKRKPKLKAKAKPKQNNKSLRLKSLMHLTSKDNQEIGIKTTDVSYDIQGADESKDGFFSAKVTKKELKNKNSKDDFSIESLNKKRPQSRRAAFQRSRTLQIDTSVFTNKDMYIPTTPLNENGQPILAFKTNKNGDNLKVGGKEVRRAKSLSPHDIPGNWTFPGLPKECDTPTSARAKTMMTPGAENFSFDHKDFKNAPKPKSPKPRIKKKHGGRKPKNLAQAAIFNNRRKIPREKPKKIKSFADFTAEDLGRVGFDPEKACPSPKVRRGNTFAFPSNGSNGIKLDNLNGSLDDIKISKLKQKRARRGVGLALGTDNEDDEAGRPPECATPSSRQLKHGGFDFGNIEKKSL